MKTLKSRPFVMAAMIAAAPFASLHAGDGFTITTDHIYGHKAGMALTLDVVRPAKDPNGIGLLYMVSRGWVSNYFDLENAMSTSKQRNGRFFRLVDRGYTLFMVRHGSSPYFKVPEAVSDVRRALRYVRFHSGEFKVDPDRLGVFGNSAGGHLALMLGTNSDNGDSSAEDPISKTPARVAAVVAYYPPVDLRRTSPPSNQSAPSRDRTGPLDFDPDLQDTVSPVLLVTADDAPTLLIHGDQDKTVPLTGSEKIRDAFEAAKVDCDLIVMKGAGHAFPGQYGSRAAAALADWFDQHLHRQSAD